MRNARTILWLSVVLVVTGALHAILSYRGDIDKALVQRASLVESSPEEVVRLELSRAGAPRTVLAKTMAWHLVEPYAALADESVVMKILDALATGEVKDALGEQELMRLGRTPGDFGLDAPRVLATVATGGRSETLSIGSATPSGDGVYAAVEGEASVYVVSSNVFAALDLPPSGFRRRALFPVGEESAVALDVKRGAGSFMRFVRDGEIWKMVQPREAPASSVRIRNLLAGVMSASAVDFAWPTGAAGESQTATSALLAGFGLDPESAVAVTVKCMDGRDRQIAFGKEAKNGLVYALVQNASAVVTVDAALRDAALAETSEFTDSRLFPIEADGVVRVSVTDGETTYLLAKRDGGEWLLDAPVAAATDRAGVSKLLARLLALKVDDVSTNGVTVSVSTNIAPVVVAREAALGDFRLEGLRSREILSIEPAALKRIVVAEANGGAPSAVVYDRDRRAWNVEASARQGVVSVPAVEALVAAVNPLAADSIVKLKVSSADMRAYGLDEPRFTVALDQFKDDSVRRNVLIGEKAPCGGRYATLGAADAVFVLSDRVVEALTARLVVETP